MKKQLFFSLFVILTVSVYASDPPPRLVYIEGSAFRPEHRAYFLASFRREAIGTGIPITLNRSDAGYIFRFDVEPNIIFFGDGSQRPAPPGENQNVLRVSLFRNTDGLEMVSMNYYFSEVEEMDAHNQYIFQSALNHIPQMSDADLELIRRADSSWRNDRLYFRFSGDYLLTTYAIQSTGLYLGFSAYYGDISAPDYFTTPIDHTMILLPGITLGLEVHLAKHFAVEGNFKMFLGDPTSNSFFNFETGAEFKFPVILGTYVLQPYAALSVPLNSAPVFASFPPLAAGGGVQLCTRGFGKTTFFVDVKYLISLQEALMHNRFGDLAPNPAEIHYRRHQVSIGAGFRFGMFPRVE